MFALALVGAGPASAATQYWYVGGVKLAEGSSVNVKMENKTTKTEVAFLMKLERNGNPAFNTIQCLNNNSTATISNPVGGGPGKVEYKPLSWSGCSAVCPQTIYSLGELTGTAGEYLGQPALNFEGVNAKYLNCEPVSITGSFTGVFSNSTSVLEFTEASTSGLKWAYGKVNFRGASKFATAPGGAVTLAP